MVKKVCKKCEKEIKDKGWPVENTDGLCMDCAYEDFIGKCSGETKKEDKGKAGKDVKHREWMSFEKQLAVFLGEFDAHVQIADDEDRFLTPDELHVWEEKLRIIWETHIVNRGQEKHLEMFKQCFSCQNRHTPTDPLMTLGIIRCQNMGCEHREKFSEMFNTIYTKRDIDRSKERINELLKTPEDYTPEGIDTVSGETMEHNTEQKQKEHIEQREKDKESKNIMYA